MGYVAHRTDKSGVTVADYGGMVDLESLTELRKAVAIEQPDTQAYLVRMDGACLLLGVSAFIQPDSRRDYSSLPGGCVVCRKDQLEVMQAYAKHMAERGVIRAVFTDSEIQEAIHFAAFHASLRRSPR